MYGLHIPAKATSQERETDVIPLEVYLKLNADGSVVFRDTKPEMGQSAGTGIAMIVCEELGADWEQFRLERVAISSQILPIQYSLDESAGSNGVLSAYQPLREATARIRQTFVDAALKVWQKRAEQQDIVVANSTVENRNTGQKLSFAQLFPILKDFPIAKSAKLKEPESFALLGGGPSVKHLKDIVLGRQTFSIDVSHKNKRVAVIVRSPHVDSALVKYEAEDAKKVKGVKTIMALPAFPHQFAEKDWQVKYRGTKAGVAVIADNYWAAKEAANKLKCTWGDSQYLDSSSESTKSALVATQDSNARVVRTFGDAKNKMSNTVASKVFTRSYFNPYQENMQMEPLSAMAQYDGQNLHIWAGSQSPSMAMEYVSQITGVPLNRITFDNLPCGGGFGRRYFYDFVTEAAYLAFKTRDVVQVIWSREDCIKHGKYHNARVDKQSVVLDSQNSIIAWDTLITSGDNYGYIGSNAVMGFYASNAPDRTTRHVELPIQPLRPGSWRSVDAHPATLSIECFIDELANELSIDPVALRSQWLINSAIFAEDKDVTKTIRERKKLLLNVLEIGKNKSNWESKCHDDGGKGLSLSYFYGAYVTQTAFVSKMEDGRISIDKIVCVMDCGRVINSQLVEAQIEGSIIWALNALINPAIKLEAGEVQQSNFHDYPVLRLNQIPEIEIHILQSDRDPNRVGESAVPGTAPAVLNAIFDLTGERYRSLPLPSHVLAS